jgi:hypothetical protein
MTKPDTEPARAASTADDEPDERPAPDEEIDLRTAGPPSEPADTGATDAAGTEPGPREGTDPDPPELAEPADPERDPADADAEVANPEPEPDLVGTDAGPAEGTLLGKDEHLLDVAAPEPADADAGRTDAVDVEPLESPAADVDAELVETEMVGAAAPSDPIEAELVEPEPALAAAVAAESTPVLEETVPAEPAPAEPSGDAEESDVDALVAEVDRYRDRWIAVQASFVDEPHHAVQGADQLVAEVGEAIANAVNGRREAWRGRWEPTGTPTEELRQAFREYRSLFDRLLSL